MDNPLGQPSHYADTYQPDLLYRLERGPARDARGIREALSFDGEDIWYGYEFSWLDGRGKPQVGGIRLRVPATSPRMVESKSVKLYLNSFAQSRFPAAQAVQDALRKDLSDAVGAEASVELLELGDLPPAADTLPGSCIDDLELAEPCYERAPVLLRRDDARMQQTPVVEETLHSHLFRSLCPVTGQPDWASMLIRYVGTPIDRQGLLGYLVSFRLHQAYHEATVEQIFADLKARCEPQKLTVGGFFVRRGGVDISPWRSDHEATAPGWRLPRQ